MDVKEKYSIVVGSTVFFEGMDGFRPTDTDRLVITDNKFGENMEYRIRIGNCDNILIWSGISAEELFEYDKTSDPLSCGKWLVPEVCAYYGVNLEDVSENVGNRFNEIDDKHKYEKYIWDCYCENGRMELDKKQRQKAYDLYRKYRDDKHTTISR